jgi:hypothetical protein
MPRLRSNIKASHLVTVYCDLDRCFHAVIKPQPSRRFDHTLQFLLLTHSFVSTKEFNMPLHVSLSATVIPVSHFPFTQPRLCCLVA